MDYEISCGFVLINSKTKKILVVKTLRDFEWDLPKGHLEEGEELLEAALRELEEETQIRKENVDIIKNNEEPIQHSYEYKSPVTKNTRKIHLFLAKTLQNPIISEEHCGFAWCTLEEALEYLKFEDVQNALRELYSKY